MNGLPTKYIPAFSALMKSLEAHVSSKGHVVDVKFEQAPPAIITTIAGFRTSLGDMAGDITFSITVPASKDMREAVKAFNIELYRAQLGDQ